MMKNMVQLIVVSDLHTGSDNADQMVEKVEMLSRLAGSENLATTDIVLVFAGDLTNTGAEKEFEDLAAGLEFFEEGVHRLKPECRIYYIAAPGNHDIDLISNRELYEKILQNDSDDVLELALKRQSNFFNFEAKTLSADIAENKVFWQRAIQIGDAVKINFNIINTSCLTYLGQEKGCLKIPTRCVYQNVKESPDDISITLMHHPLSWLEDGIRHELSRKIRKYSCMLISGHEHTEDNYVLQSEDGEVMHIECGVCGTADPMDSYAVSAYLEIDDKGVASCGKLLYKWNGSNYVKIDEIASYVLKRNRYVDGYLFSETHEQWLDQLPSGLSHSSVGELKFDDIYVDRRLRYTDGTGSTLKILDSDAIISEDSPNLRSIITGEDSSGKTMLAKNYVKKLFANGRVPLYFEGAKVNARNVVKVLDDAYAKQYSDRKFDEYLSIDFEKRAIIIDNFESIILTGVTRAELLKMLKDSFAIVIIFADESAYFDFSSDVKLFSEISNSYAVYKLLELSPKAINRMVEKWNDLTPHDNMPYRVIEEQNLEMQAKLHRLTGRSLVPRYPGYIMLFMFALTNESESSRMTDIGTYGSLYEIVIRKQLADAVSSKLDLQCLSSYLEEFAFYLFKKDAKEITETDYYEFAKEFNAFHATSYSPSHLINSLLRAEVIKETSDYNEVKYFSFVYEYYYYYFVAKYFASNISDEDVKEYVKGLCPGFSDIRKANIWLFLTHLSRDKFIISTLCGWADSIFAGVPESRFEGDVDFIEKLRKRQRELSFKDKDYREAKLERLSRAEADSEMGIPEDPAEADSFSDEKEDEGEAVVNLMKAYRTIDILGQLLRNFTGSLKGSEKIKLLRTTYRLALRTIEFIVAHFRSVSNEFIEELAECTHGINESISKEAAIEKLSDFFHDVFTGFSHFIIHKAAVAVAHEQLVDPYDSTIETFKGEGEDGKVSNALTLLHAMVKLTATKNILAVFDSEMWRIISKRPFCKEIFTQAALRFCYTHPVDRVVKEKVCSILNVKYISMLMHRR